MEKLNLEELYMTANELEEEIDRVTVQSKKGEGNKEVLTLLWDEINFVRELITITKNQNGKTTRKNR